MHKGGSCAAPSKAIDQHKGQQKGRSVQLRDSKGVGLPKHASHISGLDKAGQQAGANASGRG